MRFQPDHVAPIPPAPVVPPVRPGPHDCECMNPFMLLPQRDEATGRLYDLRCRGWLHATPERRGRDPLSDDEMRRAFDVLPREDGLTYYPPVDEVGRPETGIPHAPLPDPFQTPDVREDPRERALPREVQVSAEETMNASFGLPEVWRCPCGGRPFVTEAKCPRCDRPQGARWS